jgi:hypothetical protein
VPEFSVIDEADAPPPFVLPIPSRRLMLECERSIARLRRGQVARMLPDRGVSAASLRLRLQAAARRMGTPINAWEGDEGAVHFELY